MSQKKKNSKEDYPIVRYRVVNGNGYTVCDTWDDVQEKINYYKTDSIFKDKKTIPSPPCNQSDRRIY